MATERDRLDDHFERLDTDRWLPSYLPHWSSRSEAAATWCVEPDGLHLTIPPEQALWCADTHPGPLRVSGIQSGNRSGPVGSTDGPQPFRPGLQVREQQATWWGCTPRSGRVEVTMRATISPRSMVACWLSGIEDEPDRSGEICIAEIFGDAVTPGGAGVGMGIKAFRDPALREDFEAVPLPITVADEHTYGVEWRDGTVAFDVDGAPVRRVDQAPDYPAQLMIAVFDFPDRAVSAPTVPHEEPTAELVVRRVRVDPAGSTTIAATP
jgi:hypothetical protein